MADVIQQFRSELNETDSGTTPKCPGGVRGYRTDTSLVIDSRLTIVLNGIALHGAKWREKGLVVPRGRARIVGCERDGGAENVCAGAADHGGHRDVAFQRGARCGYPGAPGMEDIVEAVQGGRLQQWTAEQVEHEPQSQQETIEVRVVPRCNRESPSKQRLALSLRKGQSRWRGLPHRTECNSEPSSTSWMSLFDKL